MSHSPYPATGAVEATKKRRIAWRVLPVMATLGLAVSSLTALPAQAAKQPPALR